jgi:hypothetical protein
MSGLCKVEMSAFMEAWGPMEMERIALSQRFLYDRHTFSEATGKALAAR